MSRECGSSAADVACASDHSSRNVAKYRGGECRLEVDQVVDEACYEVSLDGRWVCDITCSPWSVGELAVGRLHTGDMLEGRSVKALEIDEARGVIHVLTAPSEGSNASSGESRAFVMLTPAEVSRLAMQLEAASELFHRTGGVHGAALARDGKMLAYFVDMGRHNAVDKLAGWCLLNEVDASDCVMVFSGRLPLEIMEKAAAIGCPAVIACGAPTNQSLDFAEKLGVTVVGFAKGDRFNVYTHSWRIGDASSRLGALLDFSGVSLSASCM